MADLELEVIHKDSAKELSSPRFDPGLSQQKRREALLEWQKGRRDDILDKLRNADENGASESEEDEVDFFEALKHREKFRDRGPPRPHKPFAPKTEPQLDWANVRNGKVEGGLQEIAFNAESSTRGGGKGRGRGGGGRRFDQALNAESDSNWRSTSKENPSKVEPETGEKVIRPYHRRKRSAPYGFMLSEWLQEVPEKLEDEWMAVFCPVGKRCIVIAKRGKTKIFTRQNEYWGQFSSGLPGGSNAQGNRRRGVTILDCIWSHKAQMFYVLDLICWNTQSLNNCPTDLRHFFLLSKLRENPELSEKGDENKIPFLPLPYFGCDNLSTQLTTTYPPFPDDIDGLLLYHKNVFYIPQITPLVLWVHLSDIPLVLNMNVNPDLLTKEKKRDSNAKYYLDKPSYELKKNGESSMEHIQEDPDAVPLG